MTTPTKLPSLGQIGFVELRDSYEVMIDGLLAVPLVMAAFFYPLQVLAFVVILAAVSLAGYEGYVIWRRRHPNHI